MDSLDGVVLAKEADEQTYEPKPYRAANILHGWVHNSSHPTATGTVMNASLPPVFSTGVTAPTVAVEALSAEKIYNSGTHALRPVNLSINQGEFVTLLGPSGCGKSTLLKMVAGLIEPSDGRLLLWRKPVNRLAETGNELSYVFQEATLMPWRTVRQNVRLPLELMKMSRAEADRRVDAVLNLVGLHQFPDALPRELSGGMQMRVSIARGLVLEPQLLLMDEPFGALDEITRNRLDSDLLNLWHQQQLTVMFVTHSIHEAVFLSQRVIVMAARPGRVVADVHIDEPFPRTDEFRLSARFSAYAMQLHQHLVGASLENPA
jgi:NitT/TauT family transport system ATP-binding protein